MLLARTRGLTDCPPTDALGVLATKSADPLSEFWYPAAHVDADVNAGDGQSGSVEDVPVYLYVGTVQHEEDVIALVGVHPTAVDASDSLLSLMEQVEH